MASRVPVGKRLLRINVDETSVSLWQGQSKGTVLFRKRMHPPEAEPIQRASRQKRRTCLTHVAFICDRPEVQPLLPQVVIGNFATFLARDFPEMLATSPANVILVRQKSAWNDAGLQARILRKLGLILRPFLNEFQPVLLMDAVRLHFAPPVVQACFAAKVWPVVVPAKLTWLLQPCDTHLFQTYKAHLRATFQSARLGTVAGQLSVPEFMHCLYGTIRSVMQGHRWSLAFDRDGFGAGQAEVSSYVKRQLQWEGPVQVSSLCLAQEQLELCFPRRATVTIDRFLRPAPVRMDAPRWPVGYLLAPRALVDRSSVGLPEAAAGSSARVLSAPVVPCVRGGREPRTRAEHRLAAALADGRAVPEGSDLCIVCLHWPWVGWDGGRVLVSLVQVARGGHVLGTRVHELSFLKSHACGSHIAHVKVGVRKQAVKISVGSDEAMPGCCAGLKGVVGPGGWAQTVCNVLSTKHPMIR